MKGFAAVVVILCLCIVPHTSGKKKTKTTTPPTTPMTTTPSTTTSTTSTTAAPPDPTICESQYSCVDCSTARICAPSPSGHFKEISRFDCPANYWCDSSCGSCTPVMPDSCAPDPPLVGENFTCMREGYFPDPLNCSVYYHCKQPDYIPYLYICPVTTPYYDPTMQTCMANMTYCTNYTSPCDGYTGMKVAIPSTDNMFLFCEDEQPLFVDRCIGAYKFNSMLQNCEPACPHAGLFPSDEDCTKYYRCSPTSTSLFDSTLSMTLNLTCPAGQGFMEDSYECVDKQLVSNCNTSALGRFKK